MLYLIEQLRRIQCHGPLFTGIRRGIEREGLRVTADGLPAQTSHPAAFGSKLTHPYITTDYSENLIELITPPCLAVDDLLNHIQHTHQFVIEHLGDEWIWPQSLPGPLVGEIPIAQYGNSDIGRYKMRYREGLGLRYGRPMQTIAGLHYNFSLPKSFWEHWFAAIDPAHDTLQSCIDTYYFHMMRTHMRHVWILAYLFGASTIIDTSLLQQRTAPYLSRFGQDAYAAREGTSLRLTPLGYYSEVQQQQLHIRFDSLGEYIHDLKAAMDTPYPPYEALSDRYGADAQLNSHILQSEAEFYHPIRPKRTPLPGESALDALLTHGVEYLEVRAIDINPFEPIGISREQLLFLDVYLLYCLLKPSPLISCGESKAWRHVLHTVGTCGRTTHLNIHDGHKTQPLSAILTACFKDFFDIARLLDAEEDDARYQQAVAHFEQAIHNPKQLLSAQYQAHMDRHGDLRSGGMALAKQHKDALLAQRLPDSVLLHYQQISHDSL